MKRIFTHPPRDGKPTLWRTLGERDDTATFREDLGREFTPGSGHLNPEEAEGLSRRDFVRLMGKLRQHLDQAA